MSKVNKIRMVPLLVPPSGTGCLHMIDRHFIFLDSFLRCASENNTVITQVSSNFSKPSIKPRSKRNEISPALLPRRLKARQRRSAAVQRSPSQGRHAAAWRSVRLRGRMKHASRSLFTLPGAIKGKKTRRRQRGGETAENLNK